MSRAIVEISDLHIRSDHGGYVFRGLDLCLDSGQSALISGAAGSGKTFLAETLVGLRLPQRGTVRLFDQPTGRRQFRRIRRQIGGVGGPFGLITSLSVADNIVLPPTN